MTTDMLRYILIITVFTLLISIALLVAVSILVGKINQMLISIQDFIKVTAASNESLLKMFNTKKERDTMLEMNLKDGKKMVINDSGKTSVNKEMADHIEENYIQPDKKVGKDSKSVPKMTIEG